MAEQQWHMANIWETIAAAVPDNPAVISETENLSWRDYENQAAKLAQVFVDHGVDAHAKVSIYAYNCPEYLISQFAAFKARMCPINVNYRYLGTELAHVINNSDSEIVVFQASFAPLLTEIKDQISNVKLFLQIDDGSGENMDGAVNYKTAVDAASPMPVIERSNDDIYMLYTGGTTGLPKGVMYDHKTFAGSLVSKALELRGMPLADGADALGGVAKLLTSKGANPISMAACPLMHGTGVWVGAIIPHCLGGAAVLFDNKHFDADRLLTQIEKEKVQEVVIVGDSFAKPIVKALRNAKAKGTPYDMSSMKMFNSSGVMFSAEMKKQVLEFMDVIIFDSMGSTEGSIGVSIATRESIASSKTAKFMISPTTKVMTEEGREIEAGSGEVGILCNGGMVPIGYYKDEAKTAETFKTFNGVRYAIPGDFAMLEADGTITLLGRGSTCVNSGGEKIFPEEVEEAMKSNECVEDCLIVGVPDDRFGEAVTAVYAVSDGADISDADLKQHVRQKIADYKAPRHYVKTDKVPRAVNGKADYKSAKKYALDILGL